MEILKLWISHCHVSLSECIYLNNLALLDPVSSKWPIHLAKIPGIALAFAPSNLFGADPVKQIDKGLETKKFMSRFSLIHLL